MTQKCLTLFTNTIPFSSGLVHCQPDQSNRPVFFFNIKAANKHGWWKEVHTLCTLFSYIYNQTYFKRIFLNKQESQNIKQKEGDWKIGWFSKSRQIICPDREVVRTELKRRNLPVQRGELADLLTRWGNI